MGKSNKNSGSSNKSRGKSHETTTANAGKAQNSNDEFIGHRVAERLVENVVSPAQTVSPTTDNNTVNTVNDQTTDSGVNPHHVIGGSPNYASKKPKFLRVPQTLLNCIPGLATALDEEGRIPFATSVNGPTTPHSALALRANFPYRNPEASFASERAILRIFGDRAEKIYFYCKLGEHPLILFVNVGKEKVIRNDDPAFTGQNDITKLLSRTIIIHPGDKVDESTGAIIHREVSLNDVLREHNINVNIENIDVEGPATMPHVLLGDAAHVIEARNFIASLRVPEPVPQPPAPQPQHEQSHQGWFGKWRKESPAEFHNEPEPRREPRLDTRVDDGSWRYKRTYINGAEAVIAELTEPEAQQLRDRGIVGVMPLSFITERPPEVARRTLTIRWRNRCPVAPMLEAMRILGSEFKAFAFAITYGNLRVTVPEVVGKDTISSLKKALSKVHPLEKDTDLFILADVPPTPEVAWCRPIKRTLFNPDRDLDGDDADAAVVIQDQPAPDKIRCLVEFDQHVSIATVHALGKQLNFDPITTKDEFIWSCMVFVVNFRACDKAIVEALGALENGFTLSVGNRTIRAAFQPKWV